jgi:hypothetical protein
VTGKQNSLRARHVIRGALSLATVGLLSAVGSHAMGFPAGRWPSLALAGLGWLAAFGALLVSIREIALERRRSKM